MIRKLSDRELTQAFKNIGVHLDCGGCAQEFFTGHPGNHTCGKAEQTPLEVAVEDAYCEGCDSGVWKEDGEHLYFNLNYPESYWVTCKKELSQK